MVSRSLKFLILALSLAAAYAAMRASAQQEEKKPATGTAFSAEERSFWSFQPPAEPPVPTVQRIDRPRSPLDHFILDSLAAGKPEKLLGLYTFDSDTVRGGTGEVRNWLVVSGAMGDRKATILDYIPAHHTVTGLGFAYWP